jgi:hypothetical protein
MMMHPTLWDFTCSPCAQPQACPTQQIAFPAGESSGFLLNSLKGGGHLYVLALSQIGTTYPSYGLSLSFVRRRKSHIDAMVNTSQVCKLENISHSCNHQHSLSAREAFSTRPSLSRKYSNFVLASGLVKISAICSSIGRYSTCTIFLCTMCLI